MLDQDKHFKYITDYLYSISVEMGFRLYVLKKPKDNNTYSRHRIEIDRYKTKDQFIAILYDRIVKDRKPHFSQIHTRMTDVNNSLRCNTFIYIVEFEGLNDQVELRINDIVNIYEHIPQIPPITKTQTMNHVLPDGSAFFTASLPLPKDHWVYKPTEYVGLELTPSDKPAPILTHALKDQVVSAARYAIRASTMNGAEKDFDPDAMVLNMVAALCGEFPLIPKNRIQENHDSIAQDSPRN